MVEAEGLPLPALQACATHQSQNTASIYASKSGPSKVSYLELSQLRIKAVHARDILINLASLYPCNQAASKVLPTHGVLHTPQ